MKLRVEILLWTPDKEVSDACLKDIRVCLSEAVIDVESSDLQISAVTISDIGSDESRTLLSVENFPLEESHDYKEGKL